jgi:hypothetical protein
MHDIREPLLVCIVFSAFLAQCSIVGFALNTRLRLFDDTSDARNNIYLQWFFAMSCGLIIDIVVLFFLGIARLLTLPAVLLSGAALITLSLFSLIRFSAHSTRIHSLYTALSRSRYDVLWSLFDALALAAFFVALSSEVIRAPGSFDDTMYHLPIARFYVEHHAIVLNEYLRFPLFPQNMELLFTLGLLIGGDVIAQGMANIPLFIIGVGLIGAGIWLLGSALPGFLSIFLLFCIEPIKSTFGFAYVDDGLALFCWGATLALALWARSDHRSNGWLVIAGMLAGGAAGSKLFGGALALLLGLYLVLVRKDWRSSLIYAGVVFIFGSWWYVRSAIISGDPVSPAGGSVFGYFLWNSADLLGQKQDLTRYGVGTNLLHLWQSLVVAGVPTWGVAFASIIYLGKRNYAITLFYVIFVMYFVLWFFAAQIPRYLAPIVAVGCFLSVYFVYRTVLAPLGAALVSRWAWLGNPHLPAALSLAILLPAAAHSYSRVPFVIAHWDGALETEPGYILIHHANTLIPVFGNRLVQVGFEKYVYFFDGVTIGDWFGLGRYASMIDCSAGCRLISPAEMKRLMLSFNSRMLAVNTKFFPIDLAAYKELFTVNMETEGGVLLTMR